MENSNIQYVTDAEGREVDVIVPIALWRELTSGQRAPGAHPDSAPGRETARSDRVTGMTLQEAGIEIDPESGLPHFSIPPNAPTITTELVRELEDDW